MQYPSGRLKSASYFHIGPLTGLFALLVAICVILERVGVAIPIIKTLLIVFSGATIIGIGLTSGTMRPARYFAADRTLPAGISSMALASIWMSGSVLLALPGYYGLDPQAARVFAVASLAGLLLLGTTVGPAFSASGAYTVGNFLGIRFASTSARVLAALISIGICFALLVPQFAIMAFFLDQLLPTGAYVAIIATIVPAGFAVWLGGMLGASRTEALIYPIALAGFLAPLVYFLSSSGAQPTVQSLSVVDPADFVHDATAALFAGGDVAPMPGTGWMQIAIIAFLCAAAISSLPHLLGAFSALPQPKAARGAAYRAIVLVLVPLIAVPFHAAFAQILVFDSLSGLSAGELARNAGWVFSLSASPFGPLVSICGKAAADAATVIAACGGAGHLIAPPDIAINAAIAPLAMTVRDDLPVLFGGVFSLGILLAATSTAIALIQNIAATVAQDLFRGLVARDGPAGPRLAVARMGVIVICVAAGYLAHVYSRAGLNTVFWIAGLAAAVFFPVLQFSRFWNRMTGVGAVAGMTAGLAVTLFGFAIKFWGAGIIPAEGIGALPEFLDTLEKAGTANVVLAGMAISALCAVIGSMMSEPPQRSAAAATIMPPIATGLPAGNREDYT